MRPSPATPPSPGAPTWLRRPVLVAALLIAPICAPQPGKAAEPPGAITCVGAGVADLALVSAAVDRLLKSNWHREGANWFTAFTLPPPPRNPFDLEAAKLPPPPTSRGYLWAYDLRCDVTETIEGRPTSLVVSTPSFAFHEDKAWSRPQQKGLFHLLRADRRPDGYQVVLVPTERSSLLPEAVLRLPSAAEIPVASRRYGAPCRGNTTWDGRRCRGPLAR